MVDIFWIDQDLSSEDISEMKPKRGKFCFKKPFCILLKEKEQKQIKIPANGSWHCHNSLAKYRPLDPVARTPVVQGASAISR